jgi:hypothetical protein
VYRVHTADGSYSLGIFDGNPQQRICVVLRGIEGELNRTQDREPLVGGVVLFDVPVSLWPGKVLEVGTLRTSRIRSVTPEDDLATIAEVTGTVVKLSVGPAAPGRTRLEDQVTQVELAAKCLTAVYLRASLMDLEGAPELRRRLQLALKDCLVSVNFLDEKARARSWTPSPHALVSQGR